MGEGEGDGDERRGADRAPVRIQHEYSHLNAFFSEYTRNIGRGGTFLQSDAPLPIGTELTVTFRVPGLDAPLTLRARVQWVVPKEEGSPHRAPGMGVGFLYASEEERARVERVVEQLMSEHLGTIVSGRLMDRVRG